MKKIKKIIFGFETTLEMIFDMKDFETVALYDVTETISVDKNGLKHKSLSALGGAFFEFKRSANRLNVYHKDWPNEGYPFSRIVRCLDIDTVKFIYSDKTEESIALPWCSNYSGYTNHLMEYRYTEKGNLLLSFKPRYNEEEDESFDMHLDEDMFFDYKSDDRPISFKDWKKYIKECERIEAMVVPDMMDDEFDEDFSDESFVDDGMLVISVDTGDDTIL